MPTIKARLAEGNWEGNHGKVAFRDLHRDRLAEGNWEGNHGYRSIIPIFGED